MTQDYFWKREWQKAEKEADEDIRAGGTKRFPTAEELIAELETDNYDAFIKEVKDEWVI